MSSPDNTRRHWHGDPGARHEHLNVWTAGGAKGPAPRAPWALTPEMIAASQARRVSHQPSPACSPSSLQSNTISVSTPAPFNTDPYRTPTPQQPPQPAPPAPPTVAPHQPSASVDAPAPARARRACLRTCRRRRGRVLIRGWRGVGRAGMSSASRVGFFRSGGMGIRGGSNFFYHIV